MFGGRASLSPWWISQSSAVFAPTAETSRQGRVIKKEEKIAEKEILWVGKRRAIMRLIAERWLFWWKTEWNTILRNVQFSSFQGKKTFKQTRVRIIWSSIHILDVDLHMYCKNSRICGKEVEQVTSSFYMTFSQIHKFWSIRNQKEGVIHEFQNKNLLERILAGSFFTSWINVWLRRSCTRRWFRMG